MNPAEALVDHALGLRWDDVAHDARTDAEYLLHDSLCVGVAGKNAPHADAILTVAKSWGRGDAASVLGHPGLRLPASSAVFVNAFQIHGQEFDCVHETAVLHPMATLLAALLAEAQQGRAVSGAQFLTAIVAGTDVAVTLGLAATAPLIFFRPATAGIFGCVAAIANLRALDRDVALDAFGHALAFASGTMQAHVEGKPALPLQVANAARSALMAVDLAVAGLGGVRQPIDGQYGYLALMERSSDISAALAALGQSAHIAGVSTKPFPTGRAAHGGIGAVQQLMANHGVTATALDTLEYHAPSLIHRLVGRPAITGMKAGYARLCMAWLAAVTLTQGSVRLQDFDSDSLSDPALHALASRITVIADDNPDPAAFVPARAVARMADGRKIILDVTAQPGAPLSPLDPAQRLEKASGCLHFAGLEQCHLPLVEAMAGFAAAPDAMAALAATGIFAA